MLKRHKARVESVVVEPAESPVLLGGQPGPHKIEGVGIGYTPPLYDRALVDGIEAVGTDDAKAMARRIAREEGLFAGTSSGANVVAAIRVAERLGAGAGVTLMADRPQVPKYGRLSPRLDFRARSCRPASRALVPVFRAGG